MRSVEVEVRVSEMKSALSRLSSGLPRPDSMTSIISLTIMVSSSVSWGMSSAMVRPIRHISRNVPLIFPANTGVILRLPSAAL